MYLITEGGDIISVEHDQGTGCVIVKRADFQPDDNYVKFGINRVEYDINDWYIYDSTRRVFYLMLELDESSSESESDSYSESEDSEAETSEESYSETEDDEEDDRWWEAAEIDALQRDEYGETDYGSDSQSSYSD